MDVFIDADVSLVEDIAKKVQKIPSPLKLKSIASKGLDIWPVPPVHILSSDHLRLRLMREHNVSLQHKDIVAFLAALAEQGIDFTQTEHLYLFDGKPGFFLFQWCLRKWGRELTLKEAVSFIQKGRGSGYSHRDWCTGWRGRPPGQLL